MSCREYIKSDLYRYRGELSIIGFIKSYIANRSFKYQFWLRLAKSKFRFIRLIALFMHWRLSRKYSIHIPVNVNIGYGLFIGHGTSVIINETATIGNNCNISQFTTIGSNKSAAANISDNVYVGPGVCIVEDVVIGEDVIIGAGSVVTKDVSKNSVVAGAPAKKINFVMINPFIKNKWKL